MRDMGKWKITMDPVQEWGEEVEDGAVYGITLRREPVQVSPDPEEAGMNQGFIQYRTCKMRRLKAGTLEHLVTHLLDPACQEQDYAHIFLSTYRAFTSTSTLIELLFQRDDMISELDNCACQKSTMLPLLQTWLEQYSEDFREPPQHQALRLLSAHLLHRPCFRRLARHTEALLKKFQEQERNSNPKGKDLLAKEPDEDGPTQSRLLWDSAVELEDFVDFPARDIAEQLTRLDAELFVKVVPFHCLGCVWSQRDKKENRSLAPSVRATIAQFNTITGWVTASLLCCPAGVICPTPGPAQRARIIEKWISVAQECRELKNFSSLWAILSALQSNAIYRLKKTWAAVGREFIATCENLCKTFPDENCVLTSREILQEDEGQSVEGEAVHPPPRICTRQMSTTGGTVPYLGTYLTVLTMLDTALPDVLEGGLINFEKRRREFEILSQIRQLQASCSQYNLSPQPRVTTWLRGLRLLSDQESHELSQELEPPVDSRPNSPPFWSHRLLAKKLASLLAVGEGSDRKANADQISVSSSGSSGSEMEDLTSPRSSPIRPKSFPSSCHDMAETTHSTSPESSPHSRTSANSQSEFLTPSTATQGSGPNPGPTCQHQRSVSMVNLPVYNRQVDDSCIVRVSVECSSNGNVYKSILLTSQDKTPQVIQRALEKHSLEGVSFQDFTLCQILPHEKELRIPDKANVFYAMCTSANYDFILRQKWRSHLKPPGYGCGSGAEVGWHHPK
ncbi:ral guanine nucleotide dissociation stimulator-like 1 isoform X2 [Scleropages formosus]|uniref:Ral guanine nucleotide dissociation stimulator-like 1 n=1 Tax=Scleropages formosus TaxID=113540 RepID=A0A8C9R9I2_SCLFO|nr:ral guanine nucleotide dissociation stimulator-like 1 isoform X2 [Scleropages formosus]